jgi:hypothetical protein
MMSLGSRRRESKVRKTTGPERISGWAWVRSLEIGICGGKVWADWGGLGSSGSFGYVRRITPNFAQDDGRGDRRQVWLPPLYAVPAMLLV